MTVLVHTTYNNLSEDEAKEIVASLAASGMPESEVLRLLKGEPVVKMAQNPSGTSNCVTKYQIIGEQPEKPKLILQT